MFFNYRENLFVICVIKLQKMSKDILGLTNSLKNLKKGQNSNVF